MLKIYEYFEKVKKNYSTKNRFILKNKNSILNFTTLMCFQEKKKRLRNLIWIIFPEKIYCQFFQVKNVLKVIKFTRFRKMLAYGDISFNTQNISKELIKFFNTSFACISSIQIKGRGRNNNKWESIIGVLCTTFHFKIPITKIKEIHTLQYLAALSVEETIQQCSDESPLIKIKWPNDVLVQLKKKTYLKLSGILFEAKNQKGENINVFGGIGINVENSKKMYINTICISDLLKINISREKILEKLILNFDKRIKIWLIKGFYEFKLEYKSKWIYNKNINCY